MKNMYKQTGMVIWILTLSLIATSILTFAFMATACTPKKPQVSSEAAQPQTQTEDEETTVQTQTENETSETQSQTFDHPKEIYINSIEGLRVRNSPSISGERIGLLPHLAEINVIREDIDDVTIDNITGKWVLMNYRTRAGMVYGRAPLQGWVFNGYLMELSNDDYQNYLNSLYFNLYIQADNEQKIVGNWSPGNDWLRYVFESDGEYYCSLLETSYSASGTWQVKDNLLNLSQIEHGDYEKTINDPPLSFIYQYIVIGNDTLLLRSENGVTLIFFRN